MQTTVYLIRHGETDWNVQGRWQGHTDIPLNEKGNTQAQLLAEYLKRENIRFDYIYSSDLARAYQTAWEVGTMMTVAVELLPGLREIDMGSWSGLTREQVKEQYPVEYALLEKGQDIPRGGAETLTALRERVVTIVEAMVKQHPGETLAFFTHGGAVRMMLRYIGEIDIASQPCPHIGNTSINILHHTHTGWRLHRCNEMPHLEGVPQVPDLMSAPPDDAEQPSSDPDWPAKPLP
jgi:broad specificity phosphatase PhoE